MAANDSAKDKQMAAHLRDKGIHHGRRLTSPFPNSGGTTMVMNMPGSSRAQRRGKR
jgi:hypothetical protein